MSLDKHFKEMLDSIYRDMNSNRDVIYNGLVEQAPINSIPESLFVNYFLPRFIGNINDPNWVIDWISIAGTPMAEVAVFNDTSKQMLFKVPGLLNSSFIMNNRGDTFADIFTRHRQITANLPMSGGRFLAEALGTKTEEFKSNHPKEESINSWQFILEKYGFLTNEQNVKDNKEGSGDFFDY